MKILTISSSRGNNYKLGTKINAMLNTDHDFICLEDYPLPLFIPGGDKADDELILKLIDKFKLADGFIFCAPEYNAGIPPILTNVITWISVSTRNWRDAFIDKKALISTHSGGSGSVFLSSFRDQLEYMGCTVYHRNICVNRKQEFNPESVEKILLGFKNLL